MDFDKISIGTDIEEVKRFEGKSLECDVNFLNKIFTESELKYCFSDSLSHQHLCARFCAKEAIIKALTPLGEKVYYKDIEILKNDDGSVSAIVKKSSDIKIKVSISHCDTYATAIAIAQKI